MMSDNSIEIITLKNGDLCARNNRSAHIAIAHVVTQPTSPAFTPDALREKAAAYAALADAVEASWAMWEGYRDSAQRDLDAFVDRLRRRGGDA
ncbi:hypothetical protein SEA_LITNINMCQUEEN_88 [Gordonia phage LitninMcQueen]